MNGSRTHRWSSVAVLGLVSALLAAPSWASAQTAPSGPRPSAQTAPEARDHDARPAPPRPAQTAAWWRWAFQRGPVDNPITDTTGAACTAGEGQHGDVWFLAGTTGSPPGDPPVTRRCTIPADKAILFPVINGECSTLEGNGRTERELRRCAVAQMNNVTRVRASVDGRPVQGLSARKDSPFRVQSPLFQFTAVAGNAFDVLPGTTDAVADGWWVLLEPLRVGKHEIEFRGDFEAPDVKFKVHVVYQLTIVGKR